MLLLLAATLIASPVDTVTFTGDAGLVSTAGNTDLTTINVGTKVGITRGGWGVGQTFALIYGTKDGETSTSLWRAALRGDRSLSDRVGVYLLGEYDRNTFAGIRSRFAQSAGLSAKLISTERTDITAEAGAGYVWQRGTAAAPDVNFASGRAAIGIGQRLGAKATFSQSVELLPNFRNSEDLRINAETAITAPIAAGISMKAAYLVRYDGLPQPGFVKTDRIMTTGVQVSF
jgi:putative salt-induced outer membrane protein YdiY